MAVAQPIDFEIDIARNPISGSAAWFFVIILKFIFTAIFQIKKSCKKFLGTKKFQFQISIPTAKTISDPDSVGVKPFRYFLNHFICKLFRYMHFFNLFPKSIWMVGEIEISSSSDLDIQIGYPVWLLSLFSFTVLISMIKIKSKNLIWSLNFPVYSNCMEIFIQLKFWYTKIT